MLLKQRKHDDSEYSSTGKLGLLLKAQSGEVSLSHMRISSSNLLGGHWWPLHLQWRFV